MLANGVGLPPWLGSKFEACSLWDSDKFLPLSQSCFSSEMAQATSDLCCLCLKSYCRKGLSRARRVGSFSNTLGMSKETQPETLLGRGAQEETSRVREPRRTGLPRTRSPRFYGDGVSFQAVWGQPSDSGSLLVAHTLLNHDGFQQE